MPGFSFFFMSFPSKGESRSSYFFTECNSIVSSLQSLSIRNLTCENNLFQNYLFKPSIRAGMSEIKRKKSPNMTIPSRLAPDFQSGLIKQGSQKHGYRREWPSLLTDRTTMKEQSDALVIFASQNVEFKNVFEFSIETDSTSGVFILSRYKGWIASSSPEPTTRGPDSLEDSLKTSSEKRNENNYKTSGQTG